MSLGLGLGLTDLPVRGVGGDPTPSALTSTLTVDPFALTANGSSTATVTYTARNAAGTVLPNVTVALAVVRTFVSASLSVVTADPTNIENDGVDSATVTLTLYDTDGNPLVGVPAASCVLAVTGSGNTVTQPTGVTDLFGRISGSFVSTGAATKTASFTVCGLAITDTASVVVGSPALVTIDQFLDWRTATGSTTNAVTDGGKVIDLNNGTNGKLNVVTAASIGWDDITGLDNACALSFNPGVGLSVGGYTYPGFSATAWLTGIAVGAYQWRRWYFENAIPDGSNIGGNGGDHGLQTNVGGIQWYSRINVGASGVFNWDLGSGTPETTYRASLNKNERYRASVLFTRLTTTTFLCEPYVYDSTGALVKEPDDFVNASNGALNLGNTALAYTDAVALFESMIFGSSGNSPSGPYTGGFVYFGAFATSRDGDPGPYPCPGSGEAL